MQKYHLLHINENKITFSKHEYIKIRIVGFFFFFIQILESLILYKTTKKKIPAFKLFEIMAISSMIGLVSLSRSGLTGGRPRL